MIGHAEIFIRDGDVVLQLGNSNGDCEVLMDATQAQSMAASLLRKAAIVAAQGEEEIDDD